MLAPYRKENGGPQEIEHVTYEKAVEIPIICYPGTGSDEDVLSLWEATPTSRLLTQMCGMWTLQLDG